MTFEQRIVTNNLVELIDFWREAQKMAERKVEQLQNQLVCAEDVMDVPEGERRGRRPEGGEPVFQ